MRQVQQEMQQIRNSHDLDLRPEQSPVEIARNLQEAAQNLKSKWYKLPENSP